MTTDEVMAQWNEDCNIDRNKLTDESLKIPKLRHAYWQKLMQAKKDVTAAEGELAKIRRDKHVLYSQGPSKEDRAKAFVKASFPAKGAAQKRFELEVYVESDPEYIVSVQKLAEAKNVVELLAAIIEEVGDRKWLFQNIIKWEIFRNGG